MNLNEIKIPEKLEKNKKPILIILAALMFFVLLYYFLIGTGDNAEKTVVSSVGKALPDIKKEKELLKSYKFNRLDSFIKEKTRVEPLELGRENPFKKYK